MIDPHDVTNELMDAFFTELNTIKNLRIDIKVFDHIEDGNTRQRAIALFRKAMIHAVKVHHVAPTPEA